jgi:hypothetical protein
MNSKDLTAGMAEGSCRAEVQVMAVFVTEDTTQASPSSLTETALTVVPRF